MRKHTWRLIAALLVVVLGLSPVIGQVATAAEPNVDVGWNYVSADQPTGQPVINVSWETSYEDDVNDFAVYRIDLGPATSNPICDEYTSFTGEVLIDTTPALGAFETYEVVDDGIPHTLTSGNVYCYRVFGRDSNLNLSTPGGPVGEAYASAPLCAIQWATTLPSATCVPGGGGLVCTISWTVVSGCGRTPEFNVWRSYDNNFANATSVATTGPGVYTAGDPTVYTTGQAPCYWVSDYADPNNRVGPRCPLGATSVFLEEFEATQQGSEIRVFWRTATELNNRGFNLYRSESETGPWTKLNQYLIPSCSLGNPLGCDYEYMDQANLVPNTTYYYRLEDLDENGSLTSHGPESVFYSNPLAVTLEYFEAAAQPTQKRVRVTWGTVSEINNLGFYLWRSVGGNNTSRRTLVTYIPSPWPGSTQGAQYVYNDYAVKSGTTYNYWVEDLATNNVRTLHGPVSVVYQSAAAPEPEWTCTGVTEPVQNANGTWNFTGQGHGNFWRAAAYPGYNPVYAGPQTSPIFTSVSLPQGWFEVQAADNSNGPWTVAAACRREIQPPLAVTLADFNADPQGDHVLVTWETGSEINNAGFNLYRGPSGDGDDRTLITNVPSQAPGSTQGAAYSYEDVDVTPGQTYYYWLEAVDLSGATTMHGPVSATMATPTAVTMAGFVAAPGDDNDRPNLGGWLFIALGALTVLGGWSRRHQSAGNSFWLYWRDNN